ncbi:CRISPR-associated DxTHG motif protein, partial [Thermovibrio sp.]
MSKRLIIAPWGSPYNWGISKYAIPNSETGKKEEVIGRTSLSALAKIYPESNFLIFVLDTTYASEKKGKNGCIYSKKLVGVPGSYKELIDSVEEEIKGWILECSCSKELSRAVEERKLGVVVVPGIGAYEVKSIGTIYDFTLQGENSSNPVEPAGLFASWVLIKVLEKLLELEPNEVIVDLTHGLNYLPAFLLEAVNLALKLYTVATYRQVNFRIYESEPYSKHSEVLNVFCSKELTVDYKDEKDVLSVYL